MFTHLEKVLEHRFANEDHDADEFALLYDKNTRLKGALQLLINRYG